MEKALVANSADPEQVKFAHKGEKRRRLEEVLDLRRLLGLPEFRRFVWRYLGKCQVLSGTFTGDALSGAFAEGQRMVGNAILNDILETDPDAYVRMYKEANDSRNHKEEEAVDGSGSGD